MGKSNLTIKKNWRVKQRKQAGDREFPTWEAEAGAQ
jgi:hypothetical protein